jgi:hypothetical protein
VCACVRRVRAGNGNIVCLYIITIQFRAGNTYLRSVIADVDVDGGFGAYYRFALVATEDIAAGTELVADYRLAPWFIAQAPRRWKCPNVDRADDVSAC